MNTQYPMKQQADALAAQGRYGDSVLVHMNPIEVEGIASLMPGGKMTTNPVTGQPEAFAFLIPMLASGIGAAAGWGTLGTAALSGAMTAAATGDIKRGIASAVMGAGMGAALGDAASAGAEQLAAEQAAQAATDTLAQTAAEEAARAGLEQSLIEGGASQSALGEALTGLPADQLAVSSPVATSAAELGARASAGSVTPEAAWAGMDEAAREAATKEIIANATAADRMKMTFTGEGAEQILPGMTQQSRLLPIALGGGQLEQMEAQEKWDKQAKKLAGEREDDKRETYLRNLGYLQSGYAAAGHQPGLSPYRKYMSNTLPGPGFAAGGRVGYAPGGTIKYNGRNYSIDEFMDMYGGGMNPYGRGTGIDPVTVQKNLRHTPVTAPSDYMHGFNPEFQHFQKLEPDADGNVPAPTIPDYTSPQMSSAGMYSSNINRGVPGPVQPQGEQGSRDKYRSRTGPVEPGPDIPVEAAPPPADPAQPDPTQQPPVPPRTGRPVPGGPGTRPGGPRQQLHAAGGEVQMNTAAGPMSIAPGGIAELPTDSIQSPAPQAAPQQAAPSQEAVQSLTMALLKGGEGSDQVINAFIEQYGVDMFRQVRQMILQMINGGPAQTEGMIKGQGGGMDDQVVGNVGDQKGQIAVSPGEYIVPADVVSGLGDGSSDAGASELDKLSKRVRMARGGTTVQPPPFDAQRVMPV